MVYEMLAVSELRVHVSVLSHERVRASPHAREPPCPPRRLKKLGRNSCRGCSHGFCRAQHALVHSARARGLRTKLPRSAEDSCGESLETSASNSCTAMIATPTTMEVSRSMRAVCLRIRCIDQQRGVVSRSAELTFRYLGESSDCGLLRSKYGAMGGAPRPVGSPERAWPARSFLLVS